MNLTRRDPPGDYVPTSMGDPELLPAGFMASGSHMPTSFISSGPFGGSGLVPSACGSASDSVVQLVQASSLTAPSVEVVDAVRVRKGVQNRRLCRALSTLPTSPGEPSMTSEGLGAPPGLMDAETESDGSCSLMSDNEVNEQLPRMASKWLDDPSIGSAFQ